MSTRCSIIYDYGIHLYFECNYEEICLDLPWGNLTEQEAKSWGCQLGKEYGSLVIPRSKLVEWRDELDRYLKEHPADSGEERADG